MAVSFAVVAGVTEGVQSIGATSELAMRVPWRGHRVRPRFAKPELSAIVRANLKDGIPRPHRMSAGILTVTRVVDDPVEED